MNDDVLKIAPATHGPDGQKIEPEQAPAVVSRDLTVPMTFNTGAPIVLPGEASPLTLPGSYDFETTAGEVAEAMRHKCGTCRHFDVVGWRKLRRQLEWSSDMNHRVFVNNIRASLEQYLPENERARHQDAQTGELDLEHALDACGLCRAQTEIKSKEEHELHPVLVFADCGCPNEKTPAGVDLSNLYQPRDRAADRDAAQAHDKVLRIAQGKDPRT